jgi:undecaprenyl diphosphate synthase
VRETIEFCVAQAIPSLTLFAFGVENWQRPQLEVEALMVLFSSTLRKELPTLTENNVKLQVIGDVTRLSKKLQAEIQAVEQQTTANTGLTLNLAISYSGKWDLATACQKIAAEVQAGNLQVADINEALINQYLCVGTQPAPDLFIRTSGERRLSNFMLWQLAYAELYFTDVMWPDFSVAELQKALEFYQQRQRRFGMVAEQLLEVV